MKKLYLPLMVGLILFNGLAYASPWSCVSGWVNEYQDYLTQHNVSFWHRNDGLIEAYAFSATDNDPFFVQPGGTKTPLGEIIENMASHCGTTHGFDTFTHF